MSEGVDSTPNPWRIQVREHPARRDSSEWRDAIGAAVEAAYPQAPFTSPHLKAARFTVEVTFWMTPLDLARPAVDLDNFVKPVLDTIFTSQNVRRLTGVLLPDVNDTRVFRLLIEKDEVDSPDTRGRISPSPGTLRPPRVSAPPDAPRAKRGRVRSLPSRILGGGG